MEAPVRESVGWQASAVYRRRLPHDDPKYATVDRPNRGSSAQKKEIRPEEVHGCYRVVHHHHHSDVVHLGQRGHRVPV
jgi:hypothetical protein